MNDYNFLADLLNKFSQLTPWVQVAMCLGATMVALGFFFCVARMVRDVSRRRDARDDDHE